MGSDWDVAKQFWEAATPETIADCLNSGSSVNTRDKKGITPLHWAAFRNKDLEANSTAVKLIKQNKKVSSRYLMY
jgi:ankyrin repeat protein